MTTEDWLHFKLRLSPQLHEKLKVLSAQNRRTMSAEILDRIESSFEGGSRLTIAPALMARWERIAKAYGRRVNDYILERLGEIVEYEETQLEHREERRREEQANLSALTEEQFEQLIEVLGKIRTNKAAATPQKGD